MLDGSTGVCGACRVSVAGEMKFACVDGPEFDGYKVDFDLAMKRLAYIRKKRKSRCISKLQVWRCRCTSSIIKQKHEMPLQLANERVKSFSESSVWIR